MAKKKKEQPKVLNFFEMYADRIEKVDDYKSDLNYFIFETLVKQYIPLIIKESLEKMQISIKILITDLEKYIRDSILINNNIKDLDMTEITKYFKSLSFVVDAGHIVTNLKSLIFAFYNYNRNQKLAIETRTFTQVEKDKKIDYSYVVFTDIIFDQIVPKMIQKCEENGQDRIVVDFYISNKELKFYDSIFKFRDLDINEFCQYMRGIKGNIKEIYQQGYRVEYKLEDLYDYYYGYLQETEYSKGR